MSTPWLTTIAVTATMPSATAIGTLMRTSASTLPNRISIVMRRSSAADAAQ